ncbi:MAG: esterase family protein [Hyphomicrobiaceae bacterium]|nr:esterase family protein [Hyphomicrobiaceae bacterium]
MIFEFDVPTARLDDADESVFEAARESARPPANPLGVRAEGVAEGSLRRGRHAHRNMWEVIERDWTVYVPAAYRDTEPANLIVFQDGRNYLERTQAVEVLDNLIASGALAPTVALFVQPGDIAGQAQGSQAVRSLEYDAITDAYVTYLVEQLMPVALEGLNISRDPQNRAMCGMSSGGICAFNAAWTRPDQFGLVISHVGSFTALRGGNNYPSIVRQNAAKPIRVFLQAGAGDIVNSVDHWPLASIQMALALSHKGYDVRLEFGKGAHDFKHAAAILPQTLKWIFRP